MATYTLKMFEGFDPLHDDRAMYLYLFYEQGSEIPLEAGALFKEPETAEFCTKPGITKFMLELGMLRHGAPTKAVFALLADPRTVCLWTSDIEGEPTN
jgi:hypothetical protein